MIQYFKTLWNWFKSLLSSSKTIDKPDQQEEKEEINITSCTIRYIKENED